MVRESLGIGAIQKNSHRDNTEKLDKRLVCNHKWSSIDSLIEVFQCLKCGIFTCMDWKDYYDSRRKTAKKDRLESKVAERAQRTASDTRLLEQRSGNSGD